MFFVCLRIVLSHTAITGIDKENTDMLQLKFRASIGHKFKHYALANQSDVIAARLPADKVNSQTLVVGKYLLEGYFKDNADLFHNYSPPVEKDLMSVVPGESIQILWPANGHIGSKSPIRFHYRSDYQNTKPITLKDYFTDFPENPQNSIKYVFGSTPYPESLKDTSVKCLLDVPDPGFSNAIGQGLVVPLHQLCSTKLTLPTDILPGLQRIVMSWYAEFNPNMFFDLIYVNVGQGTTSTNSTNTPTPVPSSIPTTPPQDKCSANN